jgi:signal transduction histidine kinase
MNAQQAMEGTAGHISVRTGKADDGRPQIRVKDDGPGMPEHVRKKIFEPFFTT